MAGFKIVYSPESLEEIKRIIQWYSEINKELGNRFKKSLLAEISTIKQNPFTRSVRYDNVRFAVIKRFPYAIHYIIDKPADLIKIQAVLGFAQDSEMNWKIRF
jgi:plasmid stabilization system protein ParE